jgi:hypothetical protein
MSTDFESGTDAGSTLVEAIVGISLLGLIVVGIVDASWTSTRVAAEVRQRSATQIDLAEIGEVLRNAPYSPCPHLDLGYIQDLGDSRTLDEERPDAVVTNYEYWNRASSQWHSLTGLSAADCSTAPDLTDSLSLQRITVSILDSRGSWTSKSFVKTHDPRN